MTAVTRRQQIDAAEKDIANASWYYVGGGWLDTADLGAGHPPCLQAREFVTAVIAPPGATPVHACDSVCPTPAVSRVSLAFFSLHHRDTPGATDIGWNHVGWPYTEEECEGQTSSCAGLPNSKFLSTREVFADYATLAAEPQRSVTPAPAPSRPPE